MVKNLPAVWETWVQSLGWEDPLEEGMATHSSIPAWRIPMERGAWWAAVHGVGKSLTRLSDLVCVCVYKTNLFFALHWVTILLSDDCYPNIFKKITANKIYHSLWSQDVKKCNSHMKNCLPMVYGSQDHKLLENRTNYLANYVRNSNFPCRKKKKERNRVFTSPFCKNKFQWFKDLGVKIQAKN